MAIETPCQTPGAQFHISIEARRVTVSVDMPHRFSLTDEQAETLDANLHNAVELVLAPHWRGGQP